MTDLKSLTLPEMTAFLQSLGEPAFRGRQVFTWLHRGVDGLRWDDRISPSPCGKS